MQEEHKLHRRRLLQLGLGATAGLLTANIGCNAKTGATSANTGDAACLSTPEQDLGPFYPLTQGEDEDMDLTLIKGHSERAAGEVIAVRGRVLDDQCQPIQDALVEIWSANTHGRYHHERDTSDKPLDPNFQGWGEMLTNAAGEYRFKTIKPGAYAIGNPGDPAQWRTPHIHFKISRRGYHEIVTQMYFPGEKLNETDIVMAELPEEDRAKVIIEPATDASGVPVYHFDLTLKQVRNKAQRMEDLRAYVGKYELPDGRNRTLSIRQDGEHLYLDLQDYTSVELKPLGKDEFLVQPVYLRLVFSRDADGRVTGVVAHSTSKSEPEEPKVGKRIA